MTDDLPHPAPPPTAGSGDATSIVHDGPGAEEEDAPHDPTDPHPDTPDDFDEDASVPRQSEEAIPDDDDD